MRTPAGKECRFFYGNYHRGRAQEECRLLASATPRLAWKAELCATCPVPGIQLANACQSMELRPRLTRTFPFVKQRVSVLPYCVKTERVGFDPHVGCGECHSLPLVFKEGNGDSSTL